MDLAIDTALLLAFAAPHSLLLRRGGRRLVGRLVPQELFYTVYGLVSSVTLLALYALWRPLGGLVWEVSGPARIALYAAHGSAWLLMAASLYAYGMLRQPGIAQWWAYVRGRRYRSGGLPSTGPYRLTRHPIYLAMLLMLWVTPRMTSGHLLCASVWTGYLVVGVLHKEARLRRSLGETWRRYAERSPILPGLRFVGAGLVSPSSAVHPS